MCNAVSATCCIHYRSAFIVPPPTANTPSVHPPLYTDSRLFTFFISSTFPSSGVKGRVHVRYLCDFLLSAFISFYLAVIPCCWTRQVFIHIVAPLRQTIPDLIDFSFPVLHTPCHSPRSGARTQSRKTLCFCHNLLLRDVTKRQMCHCHINELKISVSTRYPWPIKMCMELERHMRMHIGRVLF